MRKILAIVAALSAALAGVPAAAEKRVALTFDDVPRFQGAFLDPDERAIRLIAGLAEAGVEQAAFFVTAGNLDQPGGEGGEARIRAYAAAGHVLANHSYSHTSLNVVEATDYLADLDRTSAWLADKPNTRAWFRYPYLHEGATQERRDGVRVGLAQRGLMNAYVTIDNYDWAIDNLANEAARQGRAIDREALGELYVETLVQAAEFSDRIALETLGRSTAHVLLLHETDLNAMHIGDLVRGLREAGWTIVTADEAFADPIHLREPDTLFLGGGRVTALAHEAGRPARELVHPRTDEAVLKQLFEERVIVR